MENSLENIYKTKDIGEAGTLIVKHQKFIDIERVGKICWFLFQNKKQCIELSNKFFFGEVLVNARDYYEALNRLKNRIFSSS